MKNPLVSVIMPTYNYGKWISTAIKSILNQDYKNLELLIIDDNSMDNTHKIVKRFLKFDKRLRYYTTDKRVCNIAKLLNIGISLAKGDIIARQDADDISIKNRINKQVEFLMQHDYTSISTQFYILLSNGQLIKDRNKINNIYFSINKGFIPPLHGTWMFKKSLINKVGMYNEDFPFAQDIELILRLKIKFHLKIYCLPNFLYIWRLHDRNVSIDMNKERDIYVMKAKKIFGINQLRN